MATEHQYHATICWTGNRGKGTDSYKGYDRSHTISVEGKPDIAGSSDQAFRGDGTKHNPEDLLVASLSACHMLWYLHLCATNGVVVVDYQDRAAGTMTETHGDSGHFTSVVLHPVVTVADASMTGKACELHHQAHQMCFIASSVSFPVTHQPEIRVAR